MNGPVSNSRAIIILEKRVRGVRISPHRQPSLKIRAKAGREFLPTSRGLRNFHVLAFTLLPSTIQNMVLFPTACGEKKLTTSSS